MFSHNQGTDNSSTGLVAAARAGVKTGLVVYLARLEQQNLLSIIVLVKLLAYFLINEMSRL